MSQSRVLRNWRNDYKAAESFCEKYQFGYGDVIYDKDAYSVFFMDVDGDEIQCCLSKNTGDLSDNPSVNYNDIVFIIPLNEFDLKTDVYTKLLEYCI